jgi:non-canonical (house-cleaning) NTP pyrophosphatase
MNSLEPQQTAKQDTLIKIGVSGTSDIKLTATKNAVARLENLHASVDSVYIFDTGTDAQPVGFMAILAGAKARAELAKAAQPELDIWLGIENGIERDASGQWQDYAMIFVIVGNEKIGTIGTEKCPFPESAVLATQNLPGGFKENTVGKYMASQGIVKKHDDPHIDLCGFTRIQILENAIFELLLKNFPEMR